MEIIHTKKIKIDISDNILQEAKDVSIRLFSENIKVKSAASIAMTCYHTDANIWLVSIPLLGLSFFVLEDDYISNNLMLFQKFSFPENAGADDILSIITETNKTFLEKAKNLLEPCSENSTIQSNEEDMFAVRNSDLIGDIERFPKEVVQRMLEHQYKHTGRVDITVFQKSKYAKGFSGGFWWEDTIEGDVFWVYVIADMDFAVFFNRYPKK